MPNVILIVLITSRRGLIATLMMVVTNYYVIFVVCLTCNVLSSALSRHRPSSLYDLPASEIVKTTNNKDSSLHCCLSRF